MQRSLCIVAKVNYCGNVHSCNGRYEAKGRSLAIGALLILVSGAAAVAVQPTTPLANLSRQAWVMENGLPQNTVQALAQTRDGFVWLGTEVGLVRFDGISFSVFDKTSRPALPGNDVRCLLATDDGALWVGTGDGLARIKDGVLRVFTEKDGLPGHEVRGMGRNPEGAYWVSTESGRAGISDDRLLAAKGDDARKPNSALVVAASLEGGRWAQATSTSVTISQREKTELRFDVGHELPGTKVQRLFADREGTLWIGTNAGLVRWSSGKLQMLPVTDPLARASVLAMMEDAEGDIWVGTEADGLHILRDQRFRTFGAREGFSSDATTAVVEDRAGKLWVGANGGGLSVLRRNVGVTGQAGAYPVPDVLQSQVILSLAAGPNGDLWVGTPDGLNRIRGSAIDSFTTADGLPDDFVRSLLADSDSSLWIGTRRGLAHWTWKPGPVARPFHPNMTVYTGENGLGSDLVGAMARDSSGNLWVATLAGLSRISGDRITNFTTADGLSSNVVTALLPQAGGRLVAGTQENGWNLWDGQRFTRAEADALNRTLIRTSIHAILDDGANHLWFATADGIARCDRSGMNSAQAGCSQWMEFGPADGLRSSQTATNSHPSAWRSRDGMLWFATPRGLVEVDPANFPVNNAAPPVAIERFAVDDTDVAQQQHESNAALRVAPGHVHFEFDYVGLSFVAPQKVRYRYMLEGFDQAWTEAGVRRTAYYTNIPAGHYTFRVQAANNDGVWNAAGASLQFDLRPHFYQTLWFYALVVLAAAAMVLLLLRRRLVRAEREFHAVLGERNRIAREIHDTLAQGYVGISVQLEVLAELLRLKKPEAAEKQLDATRGFVREGLAEARQSIWALRSQDSDENTLPVRMRRMVEGAGGKGSAAQFNLFGAYRALPQETERELLRVAQEAVHNVNKHANAKSVTVQLEYGPGNIALEVRDDGSGFDLSTEPVQQGHYGLTGMRERAAAIGGRIELTSAPGAGTTVRLEAPAPRDKKETS